MNENEHAYCFIISQVAFHIQPYRGRNDQSVHDNIKYIIDRWVHVWLRFITESTQIESH